MRICSALCFAFALSLAQYSGATTSQSPINCDLDNDKHLSSGCPFRFFLSELPMGDCVLDREWCMLVRYTNFTVKQGSNSCRNNNATVNKCDSWGLCKKLMKGKTETRGCFVKTNVDYTNPTNGRIFQFPQVYVYCCKNGDRCNHPTRYGNFSTCGQLTSWPPRN